MIIQKEIVRSNKFGEFEVTEDNIIYFKKGIPAFEYLQKYVLLKEENGVFYWLQSIEDKDISFVLLNPFDIFPNYEFELDNQTIEELEIANAEDLLVFTIVVIPENIKETRTNLKAPIVINLKNRLATQYILSDDKYPIRYFLFK